MACMVGDAKNNARVGAAFADFGSEIESRTAARINALRPTGSLLHGFS